MCFQMSPKLSVPGSSSSSRNKYYLGGTITVLLQGDRTMGKQIKHSTLSDRIRERRLEQNGLQFSAENGKKGRIPNVLW